MSAGTPSAELLSWDSEWWGVRIGRSVRLMDEWALDNTIGCMWLLIPARDQAEIHRAEQGGARMMDVRVMLEHDLHRLSASNARSYRPEHVEQIVQISRQAFRGLTRFYADPRFPDGRCDDLYENWIRDSVNGWVKEILVYELNGRVVGFVTLHLEVGHAWIGLIAVHKMSRGVGIGAQLVAGALNWAAREGAERMTVVTQGCNIPAQRTFQRAGFVVCDTSVWLHKWAEQ